MSSTKSLVDFDYTQSQESSKPKASNPYENQVTYHVKKPQNTEVKVKSTMPPSQEVTILKASDSQSVSFQLSTAKQHKQE